MIEPLNYQKLGVVLAGGNSYPYKPLHVMGLSVCVCYSAHPNRNTGMQIIKSSNFLTGISKNSVKIHHVTTCISLGRGWYFKNKTMVVLRLHVL